MSVATDSFIKPTTVYVRLTNEYIDVWRPVQARMLSNPNEFLIISQIVPEGEDWEYLPGDRVICEKVIKEQKEVFQAVLKTGVSTT